MIFNAAGTYDQDTVHGDMAEIKFERAVHIKENARYAIRLCTQGARTCSGDAGLAAIRGPCGANFSFYPCDLSFNGTTPARGQIPCLLYYSSPLRSETQSGKALSEIHARDTALQIATDITRKCTDLLMLARNTLAASASPSDKSLNSSNNTQTIDSEQNITPIEEHFDVAFNSNTITQTPAESTTNLSAARDLSKRIESFSKGIMETLKFDKRSTNPFDYEIEIGATEIHPKDLQQELVATTAAAAGSTAGGANNTTATDQPDKNWRNGGRFARFNGNNDGGGAFISSVFHQSGGGGGGGSIEEDETTTATTSTSEMTIIETLRLFEAQSASIFHTLLPLVFAHIGALASSDPKSSVQVLGLIRDILPHVSALNQLYGKQTTDATAALPKSYSRQTSRRENIFAKDLDEAKQHLAELNTTSNHYCIVESDHPYKSATISSFTVEFPASVQWFTVEFDQQCGTAQPEDYLLVSIPPKANRSVDKTAVNGADCGSNIGGDGQVDGAVNNRKFSICKNALITTTIQTNDGGKRAGGNSDDGSDGPFVVKMFNK